MSPATAVLHPPTWTPRFKQGFHCTPICSTPPRLGLFLFTHSHVAFSHMSTSSIELRRYPTHPPQNLTPESEFTLFFVAPSQRVIFLFFVCLFIATGLFYHPLAFCIVPVPASRPIDTRRLPLGGRALCLAVSLTLSLSLSLQCSPSVALHVHLAKRVVTRIMLPCWYRPPASQLAWLGVP